MNAASINVILAFVEGVGLILSPCILPILPIVLAASFAGTKNRPIGIIIGFIVAFTIVTFSIRGIVGLLHLDPDTIRYVAFAILFLLGIMMMSSYLTEKFAQFTSSFANIGNEWKINKQPQGGFFSGLIVGMLIGIVWTPCVGPIIAAVIVQVAIQNTTLGSIFTVIAFSIGAGLPMLLIAVIGRQIMTSVNIFKTHLALIRKILGLIIIVTVCYLFYMTETSFSLGGQNKVSTKRLSSSLINGVTFPYPAPAITGISAWINSPPQDLQQLRGKVILIDFWTYSCINCIRTLPYLKSWYQQYHQSGLEIIGIHSPEFAFEHDLNNVQNAVKKFAIPYPVALDNQFATWQNYHNAYWPAQYLIDQQGRVVYQHVGEGDDDVMENNIRVLLGMSNRAPTTQGLPQTQTSLFGQTPETYLGYARAERFASQETMQADQPVVYSYSLTLPINEWALRGTWLIGRDKIVSMAAGSSIQLHFNSAKVFAVMGSTTNHPIVVKLKLNNANLVNNKGPDVKDSAVTVSRDQLYSLIAYPQAQDAVIEMTSTAPGLAIYTFTFGG